MGMADCVEGWVVHITQRCWPIALKALTSALTMEMMEGVKDRLRGMHRGSLTTWMSVKIEDMSLFEQRNPELFCCTCTEKPQGTTSETRSDSAEPAIRGGFPVDPFH